MSVWRGGNGRWECMMCECVEGIEGGDDILIVCGGW